MVETMISADTIGIVLLVFSVAAGVTIGLGAVMVPMVTKATADAAYYRGLHHASNNRHDGLTINAGGDATIGGDVAGNSKITQS